MNSNRIWQAGAVASAAVLGAVLMVDANQSFARQPPGFADPGMACQLYFNVYFGPQSYAISEDENGLMSAATDRARMVRSTKIIIVGHTDTSETDDMELSRRRAETVAQQLAADGLDRRIMQVRWKGKAGLAVPTPDHTAEPVNRHVVIFVSDPAQPGCAEPD
jgi:outer membrane protein OmpA-like peptidoglycan-associated protein